MVSERGSFLVGEMGDTKLKSSSDYLSLDNHINISTLLEQTDHLSSTSFTTKRCTMSRFTTLTEQIIWHDCLLRDPEPYTSGSVNIDLASFTERVRFCYPLRDQLGDEIRYDQIR